MANLFQDNAYNVLGLDVSATQKDINRRAKEIINLLRIDEEPHYDTDTKLLKPTRSEASVKDALQQLSAPSKRIREYFFWFDIVSDNDERALALIQEEAFEDALALWEAAGAKETANGFIAKKNLAILASLLLYARGSKKYLTQSIGAWKDILLNEKFLANFEKLYALNDDIGTSKDAIANFLKSVNDELSDFYVDVSEKHSDRSFYSLFSQIFSVKGKKIQRDILSPIYEAINDISEQLIHLNISEDNIISDDEIKTLKTLTRRLQDNFNKLKELGLYNDSQSKAMRDKAAEALRVVGLDLYNNLNESAKPVALFTIAAKIAGTVSLQNKLNKEIEHMRSNISNEKVVKPINDLLEEEKYAEALELIESEKDKYKTNKDLTQYFNTRIQWCVTGMATKDYVKCKQLFDKGKHKEAAKQFDKLGMFITNYIDYFDFNKEAVFEVLGEIDRMLASVDTNTINGVDNYRNKVIENASKSFGEQFEQTILIILLDCSIYIKLSQKLPALKRKNAAKGWIWTIVIFIGIGIFGSMGDSGSGSSEYDTCVEEHDSLKSQVESIESRMNSYSLNNDVDSYNALVPQQNELVSQANAKASECNALR